MHQRVGRRGRLSVVVVVAVGLLAASFGSARNEATAAGSGPWTPTGACTNVVVIGARGSGQLPTDNGGLGPEVYGIYQWLADEVAEVGLTTSYLPVTYPAVGMEKWLGKDTDIWESVDTGKIGTRIAVASVVDKCPDARIVLAGYSQGAWAVKRGAAFLVKEHETNISALVLAGDPSFDPGGGGRVLGGPAPGLSGVAAAEAPAGYIKNRTYNICMAGDPVCQGNQFDIATIIELWADGGLGVHTETYKRPWISELIGIVVAAGEFKNSGPDPSEGSPTHVSTALIVDSSGSMSWNDPQGRRRDAARAYLTASATNDEVAVIDFDDVARTAAPASKVGAGRPLLHGAIDTIDSNGGTNLGAGLDAGCEALDGATGATRAALFFTDGDGQYSDEVRCFADRGWAVHVFGLGPDVNATVLQGIADASGGSYRSLAEATNLTCEFQQVRATIGGGTPQPCEPTGSIAPGQLIVRNHVVSSAATQVTFTNSWIGSDIEMRLVSPSGRRIERGTTDSDVVADRGASYETVSIMWPQPGEWTVEFYGLDVPPEGEPFTFSTVELPDENVPPAAAMDVTVDADGTVHVDASASTDETGIVAHEWRFGDGAVAEGVRASHRYSSSGPYLIELLVVDGGFGVGAASRLVQVVVPLPPAEPPEPPAPAPPTPTPPSTEAPASPSVLRPVPITTERPSVQRAVIERPVPRSLAITGTSTGPLIALGGALLLVGCALVGGTLVGRRRC